jgi:hypothetical protein
LEFFQESFFWKVFVTGLNWRYFATSGLAESFEIQKFIPAFSSFLSQHSASALVSENESW